MISRLKNGQRLLLLIALVISGAGQAVEPDPAALVKQADGYRQLYDNAEMVVRLTSFKDERQERESVLRVLIKGSEKAVVKVMNGADTGQFVLMTNQGLWVKMPRTTRIVRITPIQRLMGEASYGDIGRMRWQDDYQAELNYKLPESVSDVPAWPLTLTAKSDSAVYTKIDLWVARDDGRPLEATFYLKSGKAIKRAIFSRPEQINEKIGVRKITFIDELKPSQRTVLVTEEVVAKPLPDRLFSLEGFASQ